MRPIRVFQCKDDCCVVRVPSKRFWFVQDAGGYKNTVTSFPAAVELADEIRNSLPVEPTA